MKSLSTHIKYSLECDGAATPATVMGMGNPMAPEGDAVGSGDMFPTKKSGKKKVKPSKERQEWPNDAGQNKTDEGLLDDDFGLEDSDLGLGFDDMLEQYVSYMMGRIRPTESEYEQFFKNFKAVCTEVSASLNLKVSVLRACRGKEYTIIGFYKKTGCGDPRSMLYTNGIEIRKFIKNPRPEACQIAWDGKRITRRMDYSVNHPTQLNTRVVEFMALPGYVWDKISEMA